MTSSFSKALLPNVFQDNLEEEKLGDLVVESQEYHDFFALPISTIVDGERTTPFT